MSFAFILREMQKATRPCPYKLRVGSTISVLYTVEHPGKPDKRKWFKGTVIRLGRFARAYQSVTIQYHDEQVAGFKLYYHLYRRRGIEAAWTIHSI